MFRKRRLVASSLGLLFGLTGLAAAAPGMAVGIVALDDTHWGAPQSPNDTHWGFEAHPLEGVSESDGA